MSKMFKTERRDKIIEHLKKQHRATVKELSEILGVSEATLRSDLQWMEEEGLLQRTHGGAVLQAEAPTETNFVVRQMKNLEEKKAIAAKALEMVDNGQCILLDASSTALEMAKMLRKKTIRLIVVTSGIYAALELRENPGITVILIGGVLRVGSFALEGTLGTQILNQINVDTMFASARGFTIEDGLTDFNVYEVELKKEMAKAAKKLVALLDYSKLGKSSISSFARTADIDTIITDSKAPQEIVDSLTALNINVVTAG
jgi:DeoR/GlpR family transcriptional regulator of sugar metabolism